MMKYTICLKSTMIFFKQVPKLEGMNILYDDVKLVNLISFFLYSCVPIITIIYLQRQIDQKSNVKAIWKGDWQTKFEANNQHVNSIHNLQLHSGVFTEVLLNERLLDAIEDIMESGNIVLHHTKAHLKPPEQGAPFPMHQDYHYFPYKDHSMLAIFIHLDDTSPENGGLAIFPGSHKNGPLQVHRQC